MKVSVVLPSYNYGKYLKTAIESALNQNFTGDGYEIVIVHRESQDNTPEVLKGYASHPRIKIIRQTGKGLAKASNIGISNSSGEYIVRLDADDIFYPNILEIETWFLDANPEIDFVYPDYVYYVEEKGVRTRKSLPFFDADEISNRGDFLSGGTMYRRKLFETFGYYDETLPTLENYEFILRLLSHGVQGYHIKLPLFEYRIHRGSMSEDSRLAREIGEKIAVKYDKKYNVGRNHPVSWKE